MSKKLIEITLFILMLAAFGSIGCWAAFDSIWWKPVDQDAGRWMILMFLHLISLMAFPFYKSVARS